MIYSKESFFPLQTIHIKAVPGESPPWQSKILPGENEENEDVRQAAEGGYQA